MEHRGFSVVRCRRTGIEAVEADTPRVFARHTHEHFGIGLIGRGAQKSASGRGTVEAGAGDIITVNPGEVHDGAPIGDGGRAWRMLYLAPDLVGELAADIVEGRAAPSLEFEQPVLKDARMAHRFSELFRALTRCEGDAGTLGEDQTLILLLAGLMQLKPCSAHAIPAGMASARAMMDDDPAKALTLAELAQEAGLSRYQFLRGFTRATGLTPHAYLLQRRIHRVRQLLCKGTGPADAAAASGFADQSHMSRHFVRSFGISPGAYAKALR